MTSIIKAENLSKRYRVGALQRPTSLRDTVADLVRAPLRRLRNGANKDGTIWALRDVSFEVAPGEVLGVIGRNGAGKSTLLKILSRITKPTSGRVRLDGRVGSLLEVGTGFHSELTGRENVFLNGAILGMTRREIEAKFDEIVAFAETESFLDTPVKHYSSGMIVRLAFAVAAHLEPEILLIDEVLAVGDFAFQKKCLGKMNEVAKHGRTVLFVSHDLGAVNGLCTRAILLHEGQIIKAGQTHEVTAHYLNRANKLYSPVTWFEIPRGDNHEIRLFSAVVTQHGEPTNAIDCRQPFKIELGYEALKPLPGSRMFFIVRNARGEIVFSSSDYDVPSEPSLKRESGKFAAEIEIPGGLLKAGSYFASFGADIKNERIIFTADDVLEFDLFESGDDTMAERHKRIGLVAPLLKWQISEVRSRQDS
jgi:lipopolysaccharide transport system ATP-binding protein